MGAHGVKSEGEMDWGTMVRDFLDFQGNEAEINTKGMNRTGVSWFSTADYDVWDLPTRMLTRLGQHASSWGRNFATWGNRLRKRAQCLRCEGHLAKRSEDSSTRGSMSARRVERALNITCKLCRLIIDFILAFGESLCSSPSDSSRQYCARSPQCIYVTSWNSW